MKTPLCLITACFCALPLHSQTAKAREYVNIGTHKASRGNMKGTIASFTKATSG